MAKDMYNGGNESATTVRQREYDERYIKESIIYYKQEDHGESAVDTTVRSIKERVEILRKCEAVRIRSSGSTGFQASAHY
jgi:hypothetical protein